MSYIGPISPSISILLATYNWPQALELVLESMNAQTDKDFEVLIADDGSRPDTVQLITAFSKTANFPIQHLWQEDLGFRKTAILNQAIKHALGCYLVFLDGDCITQPDFVARHRALAQSGYLVTGSRILLGQRLTNDLIAPESILKNRFFRSLEHSKFLLIVDRLLGQLNKCAPLWIKVPDNRWRVYPGFVWKRIKGCNMACWRDDAVRIGGFDESMVGWGHEDADFVFRLQQSGLKRKSGAWATEVLHLDHPVGDQSKAAANAAKVREKILEKGRAYDRGQEVGNGP
jgi:glycosyltransferase involved in cell wall biosynthesis